MLKFSTQSEQLSPLSVKGLTSTSFINYPYFQHLVYLFPRSYSPWKNWDIVTIVKKNLGCTDNEIGTYNLGT